MLHPLSCQVKSMQQLMRGLPIKQFLNCLLVVSWVSVHVLVLNSDSPESC